MDATEMNEHKPRKRGLSGRKAILTLALTLALIASAGFLIGFSEESIADTSGSCGDDLTYSYTESTKTLTISGEGDMYDYESVRAPWYSYKNDIPTLIINSGVTSVGNYAFINCSGLTGSLDIPDSVASIGNNAFQSCSKLTNISFGKGLTSVAENAFSSHIFYDADGETELQKNAENLKDSAFAGETVKKMIRQEPAAGYTVTFESNGGKGTMPPQEFTPGVAQNLSQNTFTRSGYIFIEWNTEEDGTGTSYADEESVTLTDGHVTATLSHFSDYFAASDYVLNDVILLQTGEGSAGASAYSCVPGTIVNLIATPADGWKFVKWESQQVTVTDGSFTMPDMDVTLKAIFEKESSSGSSLWWVLIVVAAIACIAGGYWFYTSRKA